MGAEADKATFDTVVAPFLGNYCTTCHGEKKDQPSADLKQEVITWIEAELSKSGNMKAFKEKMQNPHYGNYLDHEKLFSGGIKQEAFSLARLWRKSPE